MLAPLTSILVPIHREGYKFIAIFAAATLLLFWLTTDTLGWIGVVLTLWCAYFFRDPERVTPLREGLVISPADGVVCAIEDVAPPAETGLSEPSSIRVSIFMNVFNVHVNRACVAGTVEKITYIPGKFLNADLDKASEDNERQAVKMKMADDTEIAMVQIAGLVARRIVGFVKEGDRLGVGQRFGLIRFGSRVDVYLPKGKKPLVAIGQTMIAGETVLADLKSREKEREARAG